MHLRSIPFQKSEADATTDEATGSGKTLGITAARLQNAMSAQDP